jgi:hypothetical protein
MPRIEIDVDQILTSAVSIEVDPGDQVLVMNGVIIGVVGKQAVKRAPVVTRPALAPPEPVTEHVPFNPNRSTPENAILQRRTLEVIRLKGPLTGRQVAANLGDEAKGARVGTALKVLRERGAIRATNDERFPPYVFVGNGPS